MRKQLFLISTKEYKHLDLIRRTLGLHVYKISKDDLLLFKLRGESVCTVLCTKKYIRKHAHILDQYQYWLFQKKH